MKREVNTLAIYTTIKNRMPALRGPAAAIATVLFFGAFIFGQAAAGIGNVDSASLSGTVTLEIPSANGGISVILPDDIRAGDTISGTVVFSNTGVVEGEVVEVKTVGGEVVSVKNGGPNNKVLKFVVPTGMPLLPFLLKSASGKHIGTAVLNVNDKFSGNISTQLSTITKNGTFTSADFNYFAPPRLGQTGRSISIPGRFDGSAANTGVTIGGRQLPVIAESPRQSVVQIPRDTPVGPQQINISEPNGTTRTSKINIVSVELKADKLNLMKGEKTDLHISIAGLQGTSRNDDMRLRLDNMNPQTVKLSFSREFVQYGNSSGIRYLGGRQTNINDTGRVTYTETLTGVSPGPFAINALLFAPGDNNKDGETAPMSLRDRVRKIAKLKHEAAEAVSGNSDAKDDLEDNSKYMYGVADDENNWNDDGTTKSLKGFKKLLKDEKKKLDKKLNQVKAESEAGKKIIEAKKEIDAAAEAAGIDLDS